MLVYAPLLTAYPPLPWGHVAIISHGVLEGHLIPMTRIEETPNQAAPAA